MCVCVSERERAIMTSHLCCIFGVRPCGGGEGLASAAVLSTVVCIIAFNIIFKNKIMFIQLVKFSLCAQLSWRRYSTKEVHNQTSGSHDFADENVRVEQWVNKKSKTF